MACSPYPPGSSIFSMRMDRVLSVSAVLLATLLILGTGCSSDNPTKPLGPEEELTAFIRANYQLQATPDKIPYPDNNQPNDQRIALGRLVFFDPILSGDGDVACATCHHPAFAWGDGIPVSIGMGGVGIGPDRVQTLPGEPTEFTTPRNSPTELDAAFFKPFEGDEPWRGRMFWDGRASSPRNSTPMCVPSK
jgi:cytochrome c peroxidase